MRGYGLPTGDVTHRREVVVVDDDRFVAGEDGVGDDGTDCHLVDDDVGAAAGFAQQMGAAVGPRGVDLGREDLGRVPRRAEYVACEQRVRADRSRLERRSELMNDHDGEPTTRPIASRSLRRDFAMSNSRSRSIPASIN